MKKLLLSLVAFASLSCCNNAFSDEVYDYVDYVNPLVGTLSEFALSTGNTYPAIARPWGMNFWTPQTNNMGNGWAYQYDSYQIQGFKQTHQPSPWINDYGQFSIMPTEGLKFKAKDRQSWFSHKTEIAKPHYYSVYLGESDTKVEITPTDRAAYFRFTTPQSDSTSLVIDAFDRGSYVWVMPDKRRVLGYTTRNSGGVPENFKNYFIIEFDTPIDYYSLWSGDSLVEGKEIDSDHSGAVIGFKTERGEQIHAKVASSFISFEQAALNLKELDDATFDEVVAQGREVWNQTLGAIDIEASLDQKRTFYSCLYRSLLFPRKFYEYDVHGAPHHYSPHTGQIANGYMYTDTGFWDTFRSLFPLLNLIYPSVNAEIQEGLLNTYKQSDFLPEWASPGHRNCMVGNNSASVVADAILKDITPEEYHLPLYEAMVATANSNHPTIKSTGRFGVEYYNELGYVPYDVNIKENAARTLEYAYNDWCIYQVAKKLDRSEQEQQLYKRRSMNYRNLYDKETKLMRGRNKSGEFQKPFNPLKWGDAFTEGNSWHYTWSVFHDPNGLANLMGGREEFVMMLDSVFIVPPIFDESYYGKVIHEIREMQIMDMGNYAHGNQPVQHMIYLYNYMGEPWKSQKYVRDVMNRFYTPNPDGYCGDEDNGQTSAWYVFSALGFYPVCPGSDQYILGSPLVKSATINLENGQKIEITSKNNRAENVYINAMSIDGKRYNKNYLNYNELLKGCRIEFNMSDTPNLERGTESKDLPFSETELK
ncbi:MAG: GH92 family glycosyl hydrolase [Rikenellaceae bacterium]